jgi:uncharacterized membrane protein
MTIGKGWIIGFVLLFALSLAGNLFAGGLMLGRHFFQPTSPTVEGAAQRFFETVPEAARPVIRRHLRDQAIEIALELRQIRQARQHVAEVVGRPELDHAALADAFAQLRSRTTALQELIHRTMAQAIEELPPDVRAQWQSRWRGGALLRMR